MVLTNELANGSLLDIGMLFAQITPLPPSPPLVPLPAPAIKPSWLGNAEIIVRMAGTTLAVIIGLSAGFWTVKKARVEPGVLESTVQKNQFDMRKGQLEMEKIEAEKRKLELEIIEKQLNMGQVLSDSQNEYITVYRDYVTKQDEYMRILQENIERQREYVNNTAQPTAELIGRVQMFLLKFIAFFLVLKFYDGFEIAYSYLLDSTFILFDLIINQTIFFKLVPGFLESLAFIKISLKFLPIFVYIIIIFSWGLPLFNEVNKFAKYHFNELPISPSYISSSLVDIIKRFESIFFKLADKKDNNA